MWDVLVRFQGTRQDKGKHVHEGRVIDPSESATLQTAPMIRMRVRGHPCDCPRSDGGPLRLCRFRELSSNLQQIRQFVLDELDRLKDLGLGTGAGNHHLAAAEYQADNLGVVESVD